MYKSWNNIHCYSTLKQYPLLQHIFKTLPSQKATRLELGGPVGQPRDRIFVSAGMNIKGLTRKGKQFLDFNTNLTEQIQTL